MGVQARRVAVFDAVRVRMSVLMFMSVLVS